MKTPKTTKSARLKWGGEYAGGIALEIDGQPVAIVRDSIVSPVHGYYPPHPAAPRVKRFALRRGLACPLY